jgi:hypothetical protein
LHEGDSGFFPDAGNARHVIRAVARQSQDIRHPVGRYAEFLLDACDVDDFHIGSALARFIHFGFLIDKLHVILIRRHEEGANMFVRGFPGQRADDVVGLVTV